MTSSLSAEPLPFKRSLVDGKAFVAELSAAEIRLTIDGSVEPSLSASSLEPDGVGDLDVSISAGTVRLSRKSQRQAFPRLRVEAVIPPEWPLSIAGADLLVHLEGRGAAENPVQAANGGPAVQLVLVRSQLNASGLPALGAVLEDSWLLGNSIGSLELTATGSSVELRGIAGRARVEGHGSRFVLHDVGGTFEARLEGGEGDVNGGVGASVAEVIDARLRLTGREGEVRLSGARSELELLSTSGAVTVGGEELLARLEDVRGKVAMQLAGGTLGANGLTGDLRLVLSNGTDAQVHRLTGELGLELGGGARLTVSGARALRGTAADGSLLAEGITRMDLAAERSSVTVRGVASIARLALTDCESELDFTNLGGNPTISLLGATRARAWMRSPCIVSSRPSGGGVGAGDVQVTGCDLNAPGQGLQTMALRRNYGGQARVLTVDLAEASKLEVASSP